MPRTRKALVALGALGLGLTACHSLPAQFAPIQILRSSSGRVLANDPFDEVAPDIAPQAAGATAVAQPATAASEAASSEAKAEQRKRERLEEIRKLTFDRRPSTILRLWSERGVSANEKATTTTEAYASKPDVGVAPAPATAKEEPKGDAAPPKPEDAAKAEAEAKAKAAAEAAKALAEAEAKEKKAFTELLKSISDTVTLGQWDELGKTLRDREKLNESEATALYDRMLDQLGSVVPVDFSQVTGFTKEMQQAMQAMMNNQRNGQGQRFAEKHAIGFADLSAMMRAAPLKLKDDQIVRLSRLLRGALSQGNRLDEFTAVLKSEGDSLISKTHAALLLSSCGQDEFTIDFLPSVEDASAAKNRQALNLLAKHYLAKYQKDLQESFQESAWKATLAALELPRLPKPATDEPTTTTGADQTPLTAEQREAKAKERAQVLLTYSSDENERTEALTRAVMLAPQVRSELGKAWLSESFTKYPERGREIMAKIGTATAQLLSQMPQDEANRSRHLELQHAAVTEFFASQPKIDSSWSGILNLLANNWLQEAQVSQQYSRDSQYGPLMRRDIYGNIYYAQNEDPFGEQQMPIQMGSIAAVKVSKVLETSPTGSWLESIEPALRPQFTMTLCRLWLKVNEDAKAFPYIEQLAATHPTTARELSEEFLKVWTSNHNPNEAKQRTNYYMFVYGFEQKADKIPLTRSKQERNLTDLSQWLDRLRALPLEGKIDESLLVKAFMTCHSVAEVFSIEDIEKVFGKWEDMKPATLAALVQQMRSNLAGQWRDPNVQRDAKTNRKKADIEAAVMSGYATALGVLDKALARYPEDWQLLTARGAVMHDANDYQQEIAPSSDFSARRQAAFDVFAKAAAAYVKAAPELPEREQKNDVFDTWFYAALGAADLKNISEKNRPVDNQLPLIAAAMNSLGGEVGTRHRDRFANALFTRMSAVSPSCKFRYVEGGFKLVGDNPQAQEARKVYDYYKDLVTEMKLVARLDGDARVGSKEPFGVFIDLQHTVQIEREAGGFGKYLQNQSNMLYAYNYGRPIENYRDKFQDAAKLALQDHFDILSVTFNHADSKSIPADQPGWRTTPYAYILLKARGPEVDKLPSLKIDLDFLDTSGYVVLPINSAPLPIDAKEEAGAKEAKDLKLVQILDERQSKEGKLVVEAKASAHGLVPSLEQVLDTKIEGFELAGVEDSGVSVVEFDKEATRPVMLSERTWTLKFQAADPSQPAPKSFTFPKVLVETSELNHQRYVDADLEDVEPTIALVSEYGSNRQAWTIGILSTLGGLVLLIAAFAAARGMQQSPVDDSAAKEEPLTPFSLLSRLQRFAQDASLPRDKAGKLREDIAALEQYYFSEASSRGNAPDLNAVAARWR
ncbi:MAG: hypothetical protein U0892_00250 [Pirellulales bacterium]